MTTIQILQAAKASAPELAILDTETKNKALIAMADSLESDADIILGANALDVAQAKDTIGDVMTDRLRLTPERIKGMADGIRAVAALPDPVGEVMERTV